MSFKQLLFFFFFLNTPDMGREEQRANKRRQRENQRDSGIDSASHISQGTCAASVERADPLSELSSPPRQGDSAPHGSVAPGASQ